MNEVAAASRPSQSHFPGGAGGEPGGKNVTSISVTLGGGPDLAAGGGIGGTKTQDPVQIPLDPELFWTPPRESTGPGVKKICLVYIANDLELFMCVLCNCGGIL